MDEKRMTTKIDPVTGSHPAVNFKFHPAVKGPLYHFDERSFREAVVEETVKRTVQDCGKWDPQVLLEETLYLESIRTKRFRKKIWQSPYLWRKNQKDRDFIRMIRAQASSSGTLSEHTELLKSFAGHYGKEICGNFEPKVYDFAIHLVPWLFSWLLNAASVKRFLPWGMSESLQTRLRVVGEVDHLQKLAKKGTILIVPTHLSNMDSILIGYVIHLMNLPPFAYGAGLNLFSNPVLSFLMSRLGAYTVDRAKGSSLYKSVLKNYSTEILRRDVHSIFFPAGGRVRSGAIESNLKLGLLGTALQAQIEKIQSGHPHPNVYVVPMVMNYHFVFEAPGLIEEYLEQAGKHRYQRDDSEAGFPLASVIRFFWKFFSSRSELWVRVGKPLDVFGNFVDEEGRSLGPNGTFIDVKSWLTTEGEVKAVPSRDREYTRILGEKISERYHAENMVLSSHFLAFVFFQALRRQYPQYDLFKFLRLSRSQRVVSEEVLFKELKSVFQKLKDLEKSGKLHLTDPLRSDDAQIWIEDGLANLGVIHEKKVLKRVGDSFTTDDMNLLYYYRNRLTGYGLGKLSEDEDDKGFLV